MISWDAQKQARALLRTTLYAYEMAREHCPVRTGRLKRSISYRSDAGSAVVSANTEYAALVEFGSSGRAPRPFLESALYMASKKAPGFFLDEIFGEERSGK